VDEAGFPETGPVFVGSQVEGAGARPEALVQLGQVQYPPARGVMGSYQQAVVFAAVEVDQGAGSIAADAVGGQPFLLQAGLQGALLALTVI